MEILIKGQCPNCKERILFHHILKDETYSIEDKEIEDLTFNLLCQASKKAYKKSLRKELFEDILNNYFGEHKGRMIETNDPKELLKLKREILKTRMRISKDSRKKFNQQKNELLDLIKSKIKEKKKRRKR